MKSNKRARLIRKLHEYKAWRHGADTKQPAPEKISSIINTAEQMLIEMGKIEARAESMQKAIDLFCSETKKGDYPQAHVAWLFDLRTKETE